MASLGLLGLALIIGCGFGTIFYVCSQDTTPRAKGIVATIYVLSWVIDHIISSESVSFGFFIQIGLCLYFAFWHKLSQL